MFYLVRKSEKTESPEDVPFYFFTSGLPDLRGLPDF
jgi:hypothetical protein